MGLSDQTPTIQGATDGTEIGNVGDALKVSASITATANGDISVGNSTSTPLGVSGIFTGSWVDILNYSTVSVIVKSDQNSASSGLSIQWSSDGVNIDDTDTYSITANSGKQYSFGGMAQYFRIVYTNGTIAQTAFRLQTILHREGFKYSSHRIGGAVVDDDDSELVTSVITGKRPDGTYGPINIDQDGNFIITALTGFGANFTFGDITTSATAQVVVRRTTYTEQTTNAQRSIASSSANDTSAGTGARTVKITYYTASGVGPNTETLTLNGTSYVNTTNTDICFIEKMEVVTVGSTGSNVGILTLKAGTGGGGATIGTISATNNQTFWAHHYVPTGKTCNITGISCSHNGTTVGSGGVFILKSLPIGISNAAEIQVSDFVRLYGQSSTFSRTYQSPIKVIGPARLVIYLTPETSSSTVYRAAIDFFEP